MEVQRRELHNYLGIGIDYSKRGSVKMSIIKYICKILKDLPEEINLPSANPASEHLLQV